MSLNPRIHYWQGRRVWLVGASSGIGRATAALLHARGAQVIVSARNAQALQAFVDEHPGSMTMPLDTAHTAQVKAAAQQVLAGGPLDLVCYCAGYYRDMRATDFDLEIARQHMRVNYDGALVLLDAVLPQLMAQAKSGRGGHLSLVSSVAGYRGLPKSLAYGPTKAALNNLANDDKVRAVVLRVNSGGGSAQASEEIWRAVAAVKAKKPVVVSMGRVAASGGYYISTGATKIFAQPDTLTGSIGVVGGKIVLGGMLAKVGVETYAVGRGKNATMWSTMTPWTDDQRAVVLGMMEDVYKVFVGRVSEGRGKTYDEIHAIAQGRVWTGAAAKERGLVDAMGDLDTALAEARTLAQVAPTVELEVYPPEPTLKDVLDGLVQSSPADLLGQADVVAALTQLQMPGYVSVYMPHSYNFSGQMYLFPTSAVTRPPQ